MMNTNLLKALTATALAIGLSVVLFAQGPWRTPASTNGEARIAATSADALCVGSVAVAPASGSCSGGIYAGPIIATTLALAAPTSYVPVWGNTGTANTLGDGTITGSYMKLGPVTHFRLSLTWGASTVSGNGSWTFTFPETTANTVVDVGVGRAIDSGTNSFFAAGRAVSTTVFDVVTLTTNAHVLITATSPHTWTTNDSFTFSGWYFGS